MVRLGRREPPPQVHFVTSAQAANAMIAFDRMRERGYQRIAYAGVWARRYMFGAGFHWAQRGFPGEEHLPPFLVSDDTVPQKAFAAWLKKTKPDALLLDDPRIPLMLKKAGYRVPEDIAFASMTAGNLPFEAGIDQNSEEIGRVAVLVIISLMQDSSLGEPPILREILVRG